MNSPMSTARFVSLRMKLLAGFSLLTTVSFALAFYWFYTFTSNMALRSIQNDAETTLMAALAKIDGDQFVEIYTQAVPREDGYTDDARYWEHVNWLLTVHTIEPRAYVYTYIEKNGEIVFVGSHGAPLNPPEGAPFLWTWTDISPALKQGYLNGLKQTTYANNFEPYKDDYGEWVSVVTPIKDKNGVSVGGLGVDFKAEYVREVQQGVERGVIVAFSAILLANLFLVLLISNSLTRPIISLTRLASRIGEGDYNQDLSGLTRGRFPDEISKLATDFAIMVGKVYQREQILRRQVEELKIEIDESKKKNQVSEIVESEFFRDLQARADRMRNRRKFVEQTGMFKRITAEDIAKAKQQGSSSEEPTP